MKKFTILSLVALISASIYLQGCTRVGPTEAGFAISNSGSYRGIDSLPLVTGWQFYLPFSTQIITIPTTQQHVVWSKGGNEGKETEQQINVSCMGGAGFGIDVGLNYRVDPTKASKIYLKYRTDDLEKITDTYLRNIVRGAMQDISGHLTVDSVLNNLPGFEHAIAANLTKKLAPEGFMVDNFSIINKPVPSDPQLAGAINNKIKAKQDAETSKMQLQISIAEANKRVAEARGDSASAVIKASGQAEAIKKLQSQLTPEYVEYTKIQKWDGALPTVSGGGSGIMLQLGVPSHKQ